MRYGIKRLTPDNWLTPDKQSAFLKGYHRETGEPVQLEGADWLEEILQQKLSGSVPTEVKRLFEVARGAMVYGWFFYPLYTLGTEQLFRVGEAAVSHMWKRIEDAPEETQTFKARLDWLRAHGHITEAEEDRWQALRHLRNSASHPTDQSLINQVMGVGWLNQVATDLNEFFRRGSEEDNSE